MAAHNAAHGVCQALTSIRDQTYPAWDLVVVNDGSTDETGSLLAAAARTDERITVLRNPTRKGLAVSLNRGWREARGELIARMDADDVSLPTRLERQVGFLESHPAVAVLGTGAELMDEEGRSIGVAFRPENHAELVSRMYKEVPFLHPSVMVRRSFLQALNGYDEGLSRPSDMDLWLRGYRNFEFHNIQEALIRYRVRARPPPEDIFWGPYVLARSAYREGLLLSHGWYSLRFLAATLLAWLGLRRLSIGQVS